MCAHHRQGHRQQLAQRAAVAAQVPRLVVGADDQAAESDSFHSPLLGHERPDSRIVVGQRDGHDCAAMMLAIVRSAIERKSISRRSEAVMAMLMARKKRVGSNASSNGFRPGRSSANDTSQANAVPSTTSAQAMSRLAVAAARQCPGRNFGY